MLIVLGWKHPACAFPFKGSDCPLHGASTITTSAAAGQFAASGAESIRSILAGATLQRSKLEMSLEQQVNYGR